MKNWKALKKERLEKNEDLRKEYELVKARTMIIKELYNYRKQNSLTQKDFAERIGVKQQAISRFEKGEIDPRFSFIAKIIQEMSKKIKIDNVYEKTNKTIEFTKKKSRDLKDLKVSMYELDKKYLAI
ncbi:MAG: helix-turn-helix transcriptional regulator [Psychrilyobacter sp.]|uniref:helix-turn-helix domain-containing protein n=1 Tax=Psychrilyobacter sp. TaxID=2586924 RepID=UPI003C718766